MRHMKVSGKKRMNSFHLLAAFLVLYALYFYGSIFVGICRWLHNH